jgi:hypothetical protein
MRSFLITTIFVGVSVLALSQAAAGQALSPKRPAQPVAVQTIRAQPAQTQPTSARFARASMPASPCCQRTVLLGIAY